MNKKDLIPAPNIAEREEPLPSIDKAALIALKISENVKPELTAQQQALFIAGFQECIKWQASQPSGKVLSEEEKWKFLKEALEVKASRSIIEQYKFLSGYTISKNE